jgi:uncharacterized protein YkwD
VIASPEKKIAMAGFKEAFRTIALSSLLGGFAALAAPLATAGADRPERDFQALLKKKDSDESERRAAFKALVKSGVSPSKDLKREIELAWTAALRNLAKTATPRAIAQEAQGMVPTLVAAGVRMQGIVAADQAAKQDIDRELALVTEATRNLHEKLLRNGDYRDARVRLFEIGGYAAWAGVIREFTEPLGITVADLAFMQNFVAAKDQGIFEFNNLMAFRVDAAEAECMARTNLHRIRLGLRPAEIDLRLVAAARKHSEEMSRLGYFSHDSPTPHLRTPWMRAARDGVAATAENIAQTEHPREAFEMWVYSAGHHRNMIDAGQASMGIGASAGMWTQLFGAVSIRARHRTIDALAYVPLRYEAGSDVDKLFQLSAWCVSQKLTSQAEDELERVLALKPDHGQARALLAKIRP